MFRVRWKRSALNDLASWWTRADSVQRQAITAASHQVDQRLTTNPDRQGESRSKGRRIIFVLPLAVIFRVDADGQTVWVLQVRMFQRRGP